VTRALGTAGSAAFTGPVHSSPWVSLVSFDREFKVPRRQREQIWEQRAATSCGAQVATYRAVTKERRVDQRRRIRTEGGRRSTDMRLAAAVAPPGAALPDRVAYLEGSVLAAWEALNGHFQHLRDTRAELTRIQARLRQLSDAVQILSAAEHAGDDKG
jgi:hypothetical protein